MFSDFVAECRADMLKRWLAEQETAEEMELPKADSHGMQTVESPRPIAVHA